MSKRAREESISEDEHEFEKRLKEDPESAVLQLLKEYPLGATKILCERTEATFKDYGDRRFVENWPDLLLAAFLGYVDVVKVLIQNGADVNAVTKSNVRQFTRQLRKDMLTLRKC